MKKLIIFIVLMLGLVRTGSETGMVSKEIRIVKQEQGAHFYPAYKRMREWEGYYGWYPGIDKGGETYGGVARNFNKDWYGWKHIDNNKKIIVLKEYSNDIYEIKIIHLRRLPQNHEVKEAEFWVMDYYLDVWVKEEFYKIKNQDVATYIFDFRINSQRKGIKIIQCILNDLGHDLKIDGKMGPTTIEAINNTDSDELLCRIHKARINHYRMLVHNNKSQKIFIKGWINRANKIKEDA